MSERVLVFGVDPSTNIIYPISVDSGGIVGGHNYGFVSGWKKDPLRIGYSALLGQNYQSLAVGAGTQSLVSNPVPAGQIWRLQQVQANNTVSGVRIRILTSTPAGVIHMLYEGTPGIDRYAIWTGSHIMNETMRIYAYFINCLAGDNIYMGYSAVEVDIL